MKTLFNNTSKNKSVKGLVMSILASLTLPILLGVSSHALAFGTQLPAPYYEIATFDDSATYAGTMCLPAQGNSVVNNTTGVLYNNSNQSQTWTCPIVRHVMKGNNINGITTAVVKAIDSHPTQNITCTLKSLAFHGGLVEQQTDNSGDGNVTFQGLKSVANGHYVLRCSVPGKFGSRKSGIRVYRINEKL